MVFVCAIFGVGGVKERTAAASASANLDTVLYRQRCKLDQERFRLLLSDSHALPFGLPGDTPQRFR